MAVDIGSLKTERIPMPKRKAVDSLAPPDPDEIVHNQAAFEIYDRVLNPRVWINDHEHEPRSWDQEKFLLAAKIVRELSNARFLRTAVEMDRAERE